MPATIPPPAAAPTGAIGSVTPPSKGEMHVKPPATEGNTAITPPKPGSALDKMFSKLDKKAGVPDAKPPVAPAKPKGAVAPAAPETPRPGAEGEPAEGSELESPETPTDADKKSKELYDKIADSPEGRKKVSPWKLVDQFKERATKAEARALELEKQVMPEAKRKETEERITNYEKRVKEMEDDLRYFNAEKYDPDILKANAEYEGAWKRALSELGEISVIDAATEQPRAVTASDILDLVNMPLGQAREIADSAFGKFANDVMEHRKEIKTLFESKMAKLEELKKNGAERDKQRKEQFERVHGELSGQIKTVWEKESAAVLADEKNGKFFKPREGDDDWNTRLENGYKFVEEALTGNAADPKLTPEQRAAVIRKHIAIRNRAAAFAAVRLDLERTLAKLEKAEKDLAGYQASTPGTGGTIAASTTPSGERGINRLFSKLDKLAK